VIRDELAGAIRNVALDATRYGLGHAIMLIDAYALENPDAQPHCTRLSATLRRHSALLGMDGSE